MICPICGSAIKIVKELKKEYIINNLLKYFDEENRNKIFLDSLNIIDYDLVKCKNCQLEFADPLQPGSNNFYSWITEYPIYYPEKRWEWQETINKIENEKKGNIELLEVGCGSGIFLEMLQDKKDIKAIGLDTTPESVEKCKQKKLEVYCQDLNDYKKNFDKKFDYIVAFHCLEHVPDPKNLIRSMLEVLKPNGKLFISTPYSPLIFEPLWFDPQNHPPHHMTRWNNKSYQELANQLKLNVSFFSPPADSALKRTIYTLNLFWNSRSNLESPARVLIRALKNPVFSFKEFIRQTKRNKINGRVASNVILVKLNRK
ncbi:MAG: class I SAM-dependent methyltransferase [Patescibacteria group bacterium]